MNDCAEISQGVDHRKLLDLSGKLNLQQLAAAISKASIFLGVDSAPMHIAAALDKPLIALFLSIGIRFQVATATEKFQKSESITTFSEIEKYRYVEYSRSWGTGFFVTYSNSC